MSEVNGNGTAKARNWVIVICTAIATTFTVTVQTVQLLEVRFVRAERKASDELIAAVLERNRRVDATNERIVSIEKRLDRIEDRSVGFK